MIILSDNLTTGQITVILRIVIQILSYGGIFLLGFLVLGNTPRVAPFETHDILNRFVGQSTSSMASLRWIFKRLYRENRDPVSSSSLLIVLIISLSYGIFVSLSDLGLLGIHTCTITSSTQQDYPASIKSNDDALAIVSANMINGTDPNDIIYHRCDAADDVKYSTITLRVCTKWHNSTYGNPSAFINLNSTDSEILMPKNFGHDDLLNNGTSDLNIYLLGASGQTLTDPTLHAGLAVFPHATGMILIVGVPQLNRSQTVNLPKTLALEVEIGCMSIGIFGEKPSTSVGSKDFFVPDSIYLPERLNNYVGPDNLQSPLADAADKIRALILPYFDSSAIYPNGYYPSYNDSSGVFSPTTVVQPWDPSNLIVGGSLQEEDTVKNITQSILNDYSTRINEILDVSYPSKSLESIPATCGFYQICGSSIQQDRLPVLGNAQMICATTTQVNMISAIIEVDSSGNLTYNSLTRHPSDLNIVKASYFEVIKNTPDTGDTTYAQYDPIARFTLSDNATGPSQHYIYQEDTLSDITALTFNSGSGNIGLAFSQVGGAMLSYSGLDIGSAAGVVNPNYFRTNFSAGEVTKWAGGLGASYLLSSIGYNGWAARGSRALIVVGSNGKEATCYSLWYGAAFLPLFLAAAVIVIWMIVVVLTSQIGVANRLQGLYGGLSTTIDYPYPWKPPSYIHLEWQNYPEPHLKLANTAEDIQKLESGILLSKTEGDEVEDGSMLARG